MSESVHESDGKKKKELGIIDKSIAEKPIKLPDNIFIAKFKDLGFDELVAAVVDPISTTYVRREWPEHPGLLKWTGPIAEKGWFFVRHILESSYDYLKAIKSKDKNVRSYPYYFEKSLKDGAGNVAKDILYHDPLYTTLFWLGMMIAPNAAPWKISVIDYILSVPAAVGIDCYVDNVRHKRDIRNFKKAGFNHEKYYESRFFVLNEKDPSDVLESLVREFNLEYNGSAEYTDRYFDIDTAGLSGRKVKMRLRKRDLRDNEKLFAKETEGDSKSMTNMLQIIYTRARKSKSKNEQVNFYPVTKEKLYAVVNNDAQTLDEIADADVRNAAKKMVYSDKISKPIMFNRLVAGNHELAICTDAMNFDRPFYVVELKVYNDTKLLKEAMRYLMVECPIAAKQTTYGKADMFL